MKMCSLMMVGLVLLLLSIGDCFGDSANLAYKIMYQVENGGSAWQGITIFAGCIGDPGKGDDGEGVSTDVPSNGIVLGIHRTNGVNGWNGDNGWSSGDIREMLAPGQSITVDDIYMWAVPGTENRDMHLRLRDEPFLSPGVSYSLNLVSIPQGVDFAGHPTTWGPETNEITLPFFSTDNGANGYKFQMNIFAVPEPSSVLALLCGLGGVGGLALRRRRA